jgi:hypothetical protein
MGVGVNFTAIPIAIGSKVLCFIVIIIDNIVIPGNEGSPQETNAKSFS